MTLEEWKIKNKYSRNYAHFDEKVSLNSVWNYIKDPDNIKKHSYYPFIFNELIFKKYDSIQPKKYKEKKRPICYSSHLDRYIFSYYGYKLNQVYNTRLKEDNLNECVIAYRDCLSKSNIEFAKDAIDFIKSTENSYIMIGDFTGFFDNLDHKYLKERICDLLKTDMLEGDFYSVFKNITRYSSCKIEEILKIYNLDNNLDNIKKLNKKKKFFSIEKFREYRDNNKIKIIKNNQVYGIPQGSAISAVLSNIYMLEFDKKINDYVKKHKGLYFRYSDDFIIVIPKTNTIKFTEHYFFIKKTVDTLDGVKLQMINEAMGVEETFKTHGLKLEPNKTQLFEYKKKVIKNQNLLIPGTKENGKDFINYLGFTFDGEYVSIRDKTISKYYYRMYRKAKNIKRNNWISRKGKRISCSELYRVYSKKGDLINSKNIRHKGNFISYIRRAEKIFGKSEPKIGLVRRRHMSKIRKVLK